MHISLSGYRLRAAGCHGPRPCTGAPCGYPTVGAGNVHKSRTDTTIINLSTEGTHKGLPLQAKSQTPTLKLTTFLLLTLFSLFLTGCESLPPGTPPKGPIVSITTTSSKTLSSKNAVNDMTTAIATCPQLYADSKPPSVGLLPTEILEKEYEVPLRSLTAQLFRNLNEMNMISPPSFTKHPKYLIASRFLEIPDNNIDLEKSSIENQSAIFRWEVSLVSPLSPRKALWKHHVNVKVENNFHKH